MPGSPAAAAAGIPSTITRIRAGTAWRICRASTSPYAEAMSETRCAAREAPMSRQSGTQFHAMNASSANGFVGPDMSQSKTPTSSSPSKQALYGAMSLCPMSVGASIGK